MPERLEYAVVTSWDSDHCGIVDLTQILDILKPEKIEYPGYNPHTETSKRCLTIIKDYKKNNSSYKIQSVNPGYIKSLDDAEKWAYTNIDHQNIEFHYIQRRQVI